MLFDNLRSTPGVALLGDAAGNIFSCHVSTPGTKLSRLPACKRSSGVMTMACCPSQKESIVVTGCEGGQVSFIDWAAEVVLLEMNHHDADIQCLRWKDSSPLEARPSCVEGDEGDDTRDLQLLVTSSADRTIRIYELRSVGGGLGGGRVVGRIKDAKELAEMSVLEVSEAKAGTGQNSRLWLAVDWLSAPVLPALNKQPPTAWLVTGGHGGAIFGWKIELGDLKPQSASSTPVKLLKGHSRTIFSLRCRLDRTESEVGNMIYSIGMDRVAARWWMGVPRLQFTFDPSFSNANETERRAVQAVKEAGRIQGLGAFPQAVALVKVANHLGCTAFPRIAIGCGDATVRLVNFLDPSLLLFPPPGRIAIPADSTLLWQGIPTAVTALSWHMTLEEILAFGCADGTVGLLHAGRGTAITTATKHPAAVVSIGWSVGEQPDGANMVTLSADGTLLRWDHHRNVNADLFPLSGPTRQISGSRGGATASDVNASDGKPRGPICKQLGCPTSLHDELGFVGRRTPVALSNILVSNSTGGDTIVGMSQGTVAILAENGCSELEVDFPEGYGAVTRVANERRGCIAVTHEAGMVSLVFWPKYARPPSGLQGKKPEIASARLGEGTTATALAIGPLTRRVSKCCDVFVAVGLQGGTIQLWRGPQGSVGHASPNQLTLATVLKGHTGSILNLTSHSHCGSGACFEEGGADEASDEIKAFLVSGADDQSVRVWDVKAAITRGLLEKRTSIQGEEQPAEESRCREEVEEEQGEVAAPSPSLHEIVKENSGGPQPTSTFHHGKPKGKEMSLGSKALLPTRVSAESPDDVAKLQQSFMGMISESVHIATDSALAEGRIADVLGNSSKLMECSLLGCAFDPLTSSATVRQASSELLNVLLTPGTQQRLLAQRSAALSLWTGDVGAAIATLLENDVLTADFVSCAAAAGRTAWEAAVRAYAIQLESKGEIHLSAMHLLSVDDVESACGLYSRAGMAQEAATLAMTRLPRGHPLVVSLCGALAAQHEGRGDYERAAAHYIMAKNWVAAVRAVLKRDNAFAVEVAIHVGKMAQQYCSPEEIDTVQRLIALAWRGHREATLGNEESQREADAIDGDVAETAPKDRRRRYDRETLEALRVTDTAKPAVLNSSRLHSVLPRELLRSVAGT